MTMWRDTFAYIPQGIKVSTWRSLLNRCWTVTQRTKISLEFRIFTLLFDQTEMFSLIWRTRWTTLFYSYTQECVLKYFLKAHCIRIDQLLGLIYVVYWRKYALAHCKWASKSLQKCQWIIWITRRCVILM